MQSSAPEYQSKHRTKPARFAQRVEPRARGAIRQGAAQIPCPARRRTLCAEPVQGLRGAARK